MPSILSFLGFRPEASTDSDAISRIAQTLDRLEATHARYVAAFAFVLSRVAAADHVVTPEEAASIERLVREKGELPAAEAALVTEMATREQRVFGATDDFLVTRELRQNASYAERLHLVECLLAVAASDAHVRMEERDEISRIARELRIEPVDMSRLRNMYMS
jgi:uncharacterized tellurite resistance protein B-like protein